MIYYVDNECEIVGNDGFTPEKPLRSIESNKFNAGDTVLFKRGTVIRSSLFLQSGEPGKPITYGAYGEGENPIVTTSLHADNSQQWLEEYPNIWRFTGRLSSEICNIVFDDGKSFGNLRKNIGEIKNQGEWTSDALGSAILNLPYDADGNLYLYSKRNPADVYDSVELVLWGKRQLITAQHDVIIENLTLEKGGVHGFTATRGERIQIANCKFRCIGGGIFDLKNNIRFGNAVEFWNGAKDCLVEHCTFEDIYDSGVTHQGGSHSNVPENIIFRHNLFIRCGLAAYEWRGPVSENIVFEHNKCIEAGGAFTMQGESKPRVTEKLENISACVFVLIWLKERELEKSTVYSTIRYNEFNIGDGCEAAIWSTLPKSELKHFIIDDNKYICGNGQTVAHVFNENYLGEDYNEYRTKTGLDEKSVFQS